MSAAAGVDPLRPTHANERIQRLDVLRGFALFGVLIGNVFQSATIAPAALDSSIGRAVGFFVEGSFYPLFAFLFGLGFALQLQRVEARGGAFVALHIRRSLVLVGIGIASFTLVLANTILVRYGALALLLLPFRRRTPRVVLTGILVVLLVIIGGRPVTRIRSGSPPPTPAAASASDRQATGIAPANAFGLRTEQAIAQGSYRDIVAARWEQLRNMLGNPAFLLGLRSLSMFALFLLGLLAWQHGSITQPDVPRDLLRGIAIWGLLLGVAGNAALLLLPGWTEAASPFVRTWTKDLLYYTTNPALGLAYGACLILLIERSGGWRRRLSPLASVGRMTLTNFLLQFVAMLGLLSLQRRGWVQPLRAPAAVLFGVVVFALQIPFSQWWLARYSSGPAEWLWRTLTFGRIRPLRLPKPVPVLPSVLPRRD